MGSRGKAMQMLLDSNSDDDEFQQQVSTTIAGANSLLIAHVNIQPSRGGSVVGHQYKNRDREERHALLMKDYFIPRPTFGAVDFRRRFRMKKKLFYHILHDVVTNDSYFLQKNDGLGLLGLSPEQKLTSVFRMLANGCSADSTDEYTRLAESTTLESLKKFCATIERIYGDWYLRYPNQADLQRLLNKDSRRGFPSMLGNLDCMHWKWKNCSSGWVGQFTGHHHKTTVVLEAVASYDTHIWHAFFGMAGSNNDINVLARSHLFDEVVSGKAPNICYYVNSKEYDLGYFLADGIYPKWATLVKTISQPDTQKKRLFAQKQEAYRKDVERAFGILHARWAIVRGPARLWCKQNLSSIMMTCIILHNMIVEDEYAEVEEDSDEEDGNPRSSRRVRPTNYELEPTITYEIQQETHILIDYMTHHNRIRALDVHHALRNDLINHLWRIERERQMAT